MTTETAPTAPTTVTPGLLATLVLLNHNSGGEFPVSLFVRGVWFTGYVTSERKFIEEVVTSLAKALADRGYGDKINAESIKAGSFKHLVEQTEAEGKWLPTAIYLRDAFTLEGVVTTKLAEPIIKIRIDSVDAFQLGLMSRE